MARYVCKTCDLNVGLWLLRKNGQSQWKHQNSGSTGKKCCRKAIPILNVKKEYTK